MECSFCDFYKFKNKSNKLMNIDNFNIDYRYSVALVEDRFRHFKNTKKENHAGQTIYYGYSLNFCPECGRIINYEKKY